MRIKNILCLSIGNLLALTKLEWTQKISVSGSSAATKSDEDASTR